MKSTKESVFQRRHEVEKTLPSPGSLTRLRDARYSLHTCVELVEKNGEYKEKNDDGSVRIVQKGGHLFVGNIFSWYCRDVFISLHAGGYQKFYTPPTEKEVAVGLRAPEGRFDYVVPVGLVGDETVRVEGPAEKLQVLEAVVIYPQIDSSLAFPALQRALGQYQNSFQSAANIQPNLVKTPELVAA